MPELRAAGVLLMVQKSLDDPRPSQFLLMRHADRWDLPKGHAEEGETFEQTARREMFEETGIDPANCHFVEGFHFDIEYPVTRSPRGKLASPCVSGESRDSDDLDDSRSTPQTFLKHVRYFIAWVPAGVIIRPTEHPSYRWFDWSPPHRIASQTIDPLLAAVEQHFST